MKTLKYWYYGTLFVIFEFFFRMTLNWSNDWQKVMEAHEEASYYSRKMEAHQP